ncbi:carbohydrate ABC transporter [Streptomyces olivochromogenes]|uniref:carbohydrate ABC transporter n=1 Tax=Streptomyces olivochromogenes TaxID=1963 RepID=UPI001F3E90CD|nr:carbohydrate ABC transporter [Streptomyces olivochromogenes]MCF3132459.1 carbohydrate ABC transporter [Streptomyces olivochromogenes]
MTRPLLKSELTAQRSREYLLSQRESFLQKHGEDLGAFYFLMMLVQTHGKKAMKRGDVAALRALYRDLHAVYLKHTQ